MTFGLNLLPRDEKHAVALEELFERWRGALIVSIVLLATTTVGVLGLQIMLARRVTSLDAQISQEQIVTSQGSAGDTATTITKLNSSISLLRSALPKSIDWSKTISSITKIVPASAVLSSLEISATGHVTLKGIAPTRTVFLSLQQLMKDTTVLQNATSQDTASQRENLPFTYTATLPPTP